MSSKVLVADWSTQYNDYRPHSALGMLTPVQFARHWRGNPIPAQGSAESADWVTAR